MAYFSVMAVQHSFQDTYNNIPALTPMLSTLNIILDNIENLADEKNVSLHWREKIHAMFDDGLDFDDIVTLNISKDDIVNLFVNPKIGKKKKPNAIGHQGQSLEHLLGNDAKMLGVV